MKVNSLLITTTLLFHVFLGFRPETGYASAADLDRQLEAVIKRKRLQPLEASKILNKDLISLGQMLYFDKILSGNKDIACSTCHLPSQGTSDGLSLPIGTGGFGIGPDREKGENPLIPRNSPEIFNRGHKSWKTMFWDSRVKISKNDSFVTPAGSQLLPGLENLLAVQAMFPVTSRAEMRGIEGDFDVFGEANEIAAIDDQEFQKIWSALMTRLLGIKEYEKLFANAYPKLSLNELTFAHAANAISAFETDSFTFSNTAWDQYVRGDKRALPNNAKKGAVLFYGKARCGMCHNGTLFTDQSHYNIAVPQIGPGKDEISGADYGREPVTLVNQDRFKFRTPSLRNVELTAPYFHNGSMLTLKDAIQHHLDVTQSLASYDETTLKQGFAITYQKDLNPELLLSVTPRLWDISLSKREISYIIEFLKSLTDERAKNLTEIVPKSVPSRLSIDH